MKRHLIPGLLLVISGGLPAPVSAQLADPTSGEDVASHETSTAEAPTAAEALRPVPQSSASDRIYWGGTLSLRFWNGTLIGISPQVGYLITPKFSVGAKVTYQYIKYNSVAGDVSSHNYGGSLFARYRIAQPLYFHGEFGGLNYERQVSIDQSERTSFPFFLLGGGLVIPAGPTAAIQLEVLWDVINDGNSPYNSGPFTSIGVAVGF